MQEKKTPVADEVAAQIKSILLSGELKRGQKLQSEIKLAGRIGAGRSSVREALKLLAASGYIELVPNRGAFAVVTSSEDMPSPKNGAVIWLNVNRESLAELFDVRICIEPFAAGLCARNRSEEALQKLKETLEHFLIALEEGNYDKLAQLDFDFHRIILACSGNRFLIDMYGQLLQLFMQYSRSSYTATDSKRCTYTEHKAIYDAIAARSPEEASLAMHLHIAIAVRRMTEIQRS
mgnify:CR=1 FL=1